MTNLCLNSECTWRFDSSKHDHCPMCGEGAPKKDERVQGWNSTIKVNPKKRINPYGRRRRERGLADAMRDKARKYIEAHEGKTHCENCGVKIIEMKYDNISHDLTRGAHPDKANDHDNMTILCCFIDLMLSGIKGMSCHDLWERNDHETYNQLKGTRK